MFAQIIDPNELIDPSGVGLQEGALAAGVLLFGVILGAVVRRVVTLSITRWTNMKRDAAVFMGRLAGWFVVLLGLVAALMILGFQLGPMFLILFAVVVILFLSARSLLENFGAGIVLQAESPIRIGDLVEVDGEIGTVKDITGRTTVLDAYDGRRIRIPNVDVLSNPIVNYTERASVRSELTLGVEYGTDLDRAGAVIRDTLEGIEGILSEPAPEALVSRFAESSISFLVRYWHEPTPQHRFVLTDRVAREIDRRFRREGIVIAFPQVVVWTPETGDVGES